MASVRRELTSAGQRPACRRDAGAPEFRSAGILPASAGHGDQVTWRSRGYLPHADGIDLVQHVIFRLADSLPLEIRDDIFKRPVKHRFFTIDAELDKGYGGRDLADPRIMELVQTALLIFDGERYELNAWCIMPNHVHVLLKTAPGYSLGRIVHSWKSYTAKHVNRLLSHTGGFWSREYFDRFMRSDEHLASTAAYIEGNPVKAGLCANVTDWPFSSASRRSGGRDARGPSTIRQAG